MFLIEGVKKIINHNPTCFTTPGHAGGFGVSNEFKAIVGKKIFKADLSELDGLDNLNLPTGIIKKSLVKTSEAYNTKHSFYLVNGSSSGILALMLSSVKKGDKVLLSRNSHISAINALTLSGAFPVWLNTLWEDKFNLPSSINPDKIRKILSQDRKIKAVWITSPTYEGIVSDVEAIAQICKEKQALLIVDEAHGALWNFSDKLPVSSIHLGADACVQSLHKSGSCLTPGALLHLGRQTKLTPEKVAKSLSLITTTSPSYPIMASIEASVEYLDSKKGRRKIDSLLSDIEEIKSFISLNLDVNFLESSKDFIHDPMKLFLSVNGLSGFDLSEVMYKKYGIEFEIVNDRGVLAYLGVGTSTKKLQKLAFSLIKAEKLLKSSYVGDVSEKTINTTLTAKNFIIPETVYTPHECLNKKSKKMKLSEAVGLVCAETLLNYPPGIPLLIPGEIIKPEHLSYFSKDAFVMVILD